MPKHIYKKGEDKELHEVGILPSLEEWDGKSNVGHTHAIKTLNTSTSSIFPVDSSEEISGSGSINLHKVSKTGKFSDLNNRGEAFLSWGGQNLAGSYGPIDAAMIGDLGANRLAFVPPAGISVEYSRDSGTTWQDYGATDAQKLGLTSTGTNFIIGKADSSNKATERYMLRISLRTSKGKVYTQLNKFALYISTNGSKGSYCTIQARTQDNYLNKVDKWVVFANKQSISGWSGWNIINTATITTYGNTASSQYGEIQFIFGCTSGSTSYVGLQILRLMGFGGVGWTTPSTMAKTGHMYTYDSSQNVTFPAVVSAKSFTENGTSLSNKYLGKTAKAADADKLDGNDSTYYLNYNNLTNKPTLGTAASKNTGTSSGNIPILDSNGKLADSVIPAVAITDTYVVATEDAMLALSAQKGDIAIRSDLNKSFVLQVTPASTLTNWKELLTPTDVVLSVNGKTGAVTLNLDNINDGSTRKLSGYVTGPSSSTANAVPRYDGTTGKIIKNSGVTISDANVLSATQLSANIIETGTGDNNYFQSRKFRGEGNAATYYHAVDFGFAGHNQVDFYEYGGLWNFWKNTEASATTAASNLCLQIGDTYVKNKGNTFTWPTTSGTLALTSNIPESLKNPYSMTIKAGADTISSYDGSASKTFTVAASTTAGAFTISDGTTTKTIQLAGKFTDTDTNTATAADNILDGSNNGTQITYAPYAAQQSKLSFDTSTTAPTRTDRLNLNGYLYATKFNVAGKAAVQYNSTEDCIEFIFA